MEPFMPENGWPFDTPAEGWTVTGPDGVPVPCLVYDRVLTDDEARAVTEYLMARYVGVQHHRS